MAHDLREGGRPVADLKAMAESLEQGKVAAVQELIQQALGEGHSPAEVLDLGLLEGMKAVGERFKAGEIYLPEVMFAARAMHAGMDLLRPLLSQAGAEPRGRIVLGTVRGDMHDIGKRIVGILLEGNGFELIDLGVDVPAERFLEAAREREADIVGLSAMLTPTMLEMKEVVETIRLSDLAGKVATLIGGAPVSPEFAREIGATGYARDAAAAVELARKIISQKRRL